MGGAAELDGSLRKHWIRGSQWVLYHPVGDALAGSGVLLPLWGPGGRQRSDGRVA
jgi:hypothetical protein